MIQSFIAVFIPAFLIELIRYNFLPFSKLLTVGLNTQGESKIHKQKAEEEEDLTELEREIRIV